MTYVAWMRAIASTGEVVPIRAISLTGGRYDYIGGSLRIAAVEQLGHVFIPAFIETETDPEVLLRIALAEQEASVPLKTLERGWALVRLQELRIERDLPHRQKDLSELVGLDEGTVSLTIRAARAIPEERLEQLSRDFGVSLAQIISLPKQPLGRIARAATENDRDQLLDAACQALSDGKSATHAVEEAHEALTNTHRMRTADDAKSRQSHAQGHPVRRLARALLRWLNESFARIPQGGPRKTVTA